MFLPLAGADAGETIGEGLVKTEVAEEDRGGPAGVEV
jgi:hypothetical protein